MQRKKNKPPDEKGTLKRIGGYLHRIIPVADATGKILSYTLKPVMVEFRPRDLLQIIVGASILAVPVAFTEETWMLGGELPLKNVLFLSALSLLFIGLFVYFNFYRYMFKDHVSEYVKRVLAIYIFSLLIVGILLTIIERCPWGTDNLLALKRILIVAFPASMSAAVSDTLK
ncbi:MAG: DUF2391 family protein [Fidelibacterota bacterium]